MSLRLFLSIIAVVGSVFSLSAQRGGGGDLVQWKWTAKKIDSKTYELHMQASIQGGYHIFAQQQPEGAIGIPTQFTFNKNPLLTLSGKIKEVGNKKIDHVEALGVSQYEYENEVDFVQIVKLKSPAKTSISGSVQFQVCDEHQCMFPDPVPFTISLN